MSLKQVAAAQQATGSRESPFRTVVRAPRNFALETARLDFQPTARFGFPTTCVVPRNGDILTDATLELTVKKLPSSLTDPVGAYYPAEALVQEIQLVIGGTIVERVPREFMRVYDAVHRTADESDRYRSMTNFDVGSLLSEDPSVQTIHLPLPFTFARHRQASLPLVALRDDEVKVVVVFGDALDAGVDSDTLDVHLLATYGYLDTDDRRALVENDLDVPIEQVQWETFEAPSLSSAATTPLGVRLNFSKLVKGLYWVVQNTTPSSGSRTHHARFIGDASRTILALHGQGNDTGYAEFTHLTRSERVAPLKDAKLLFGGQERMAVMPGRFFNAVHGEKFAKKPVPPGVYFYSFGLDNSQLDNTGAINASGVDDIRLHLTFKKSVTSSPAAITDADEGSNIDECTVLKVFAFGYNVLKINSGRTRLALG